MRPHKIENFDKPDIVVKLTIHSRHHISKWNTTGLIKYAKE